MTAKKHMGSQAFPTRLCSEPPTLLFRLVPSKVRLTAWAAGHEKTCSEPAEKKRSEDECGGSGDGTDKNGVEAQLI